MKILVIGSRGMLGADVVAALQKASYEVTGWSHDDIDITKEESIGKIVKLKPQILINCTGYTHVDKAEQEREKCYAVNSLGVSHIVSACKQVNITLIHISTDYVFNGGKDSYNEDDKKDPINYYGRTKADAEDIIVNDYDKYYIIRSSWLFGKNGRNFVNTIIRQCNERKNIKVVNDQIGSPTYTKDLAQGILDIIKNSYCFGIYHLTNSDSCSWYEFAAFIVRLKALRCLIKPCTSQEFAAAAKRPRNSRLNNNKLPRLRPWQEALKAYLEVE